jgi:hypothetical protein
MKKRLLQDSDSRRRGKEAMLDKKHEMMCDTLGPREGWYMSCHGKRSSEQLHR